MALFSLHATSMWSIFLTLFGDATLPQAHRPQPRRPQPDRPQSEPDDAAGPAAIRAVETGQRAAFIAMLMTEIASTRQMIKAYQTDIEELQQRLNTTLAQSLVLRASLEIMEKRVALLKERQHTVTTK